jgi:hypothetical protein
MNYVRSLAAAVALSAILIAGAVAQESGGSAAPQTSVPPASGAGELSVDAVLPSGNLVILGARPDMKLRIDGADRGVLGSGVFRNVPAGAHAIELEGPSSYWKASVIVTADDTTSVEAKPSPVGRIEVSAPADATIVAAWISSAGTGAGAGSRSIQGGGAFERAIAGSYELVATGSGYVEARTRIDVAQGMIARWTPWTRGYLEFIDAPAGASYTLEGQDSASGLAVGTVGELVPGKVRVSLSAPGFFDAKVECEIQAGKTTSVSVALEPFVPGNVELYGLPEEATVRLDGKPLRVERASASGPARISNLPVRKPVRLELLDSRAASLDRQSSILAITLNNGETRTIKLKTGALRLPFVPKGSRVSFGPGAGDLELLAAPDAFVTSFELAGLLPGNYPIKLVGPRPYAGTIVIQAGSKSEPQAYRETILASLSAERSQSQALRDKIARYKAAGWIAAASGVLGGIGTGTVYYLGKQAMDDYWSSPSTADALAARARAESLGSILMGSIAVTGIGLGLSPVFFLLAPDDSGLKESMQILDEQIKALQP